jgi:hypothetical protein
MKTTTTEDKILYSKCCEVWHLLHTAEQLIINDKNFHPNVSRNLNNCLDIVETLQNKLEKTIAS